GRLPDNKGRTVNFKNTIIIMTSNLGSNLIQERFEKMNENNREEVMQQTQQEIFEMLKRTIRPEFLNRIDEIIMFSPLSQDNIREIVRLQIERLAGQLKEQGLQLKASERAVDYLADAGYDPQFGARPVKRLIQREILNQLSKALLSGQIEKGQDITIDVEKGNIVFRH
ncbi:MAG: AAA family ATPase, partial [Bacteroidales bacterium]|nr:AAA family ATPase [Bacteroidales bacterium]